MNKNYTVTCKKASFNNMEKLQNVEHFQLSGFPNEYTLAETAADAVEAEKINLKHLKKGEGFDAIITENEVTVYTKGGKLVENYSKFKAEETNPDEKFIVKNGKISLKEKNYIIDTIRERHPEIAEINNVEVTLNGDNYEVEFEYTTPQFERIRRITGYLVGTLDRFNNAKRAEVEDRVKHPIGSGKSEKEILEEIK